MTSTTAVSHYGDIEASFEQAADRSQLLGDPRFVDRCVEHVWRLVKDNRIELVSFDVFDTVLLRDTRSEFGRFWDIAKAIAAVAPPDGPPVSAVDLLTARIMAARTAYRLGHAVDGCREGTLREIHGVALQISGVDTISVDDAVDIELAYEAAHLAASPLATRLVAELVDANVGVVLLSDMYMSANDIETLIHSVAPDLPAIEVISSADQKLSKRSGKAFDDLARRRRLETSQILHIGDALEGDYRKPVSRGTWAICLPVPNEERAAILDDHRQVVAEFAEAGVDLGSWIREPSW